jgi:hypothetical protein
VGSKKVVLKLRSQRSIVKAPAKTGKETNNKKLATAKHQQNKGNFKGCF